MKQTVKPSKAGLPPIFYIAVILLSFYLIPKVWANITQINQNKQISSGERSLILEKTNTAKQQGIQAFAQGDFTKATKHFQNSLKNYPNDPETVIYLNNSQVGENPLKIAIAVPIGSNPNIAQEMLRGFASKIVEINQKGGINGRKIQGVIVNDNNDPQLAEQLATELVKDPEILAVVGHNASNASLAAASIYQKEKLVMITPTSFANNLSGFGNYIFRVIPPSKTMAQTLANYMIGTAKKTKLAFCYDSQALDTVSFKDELMISYMEKKGEIIPFVCDLGSPNFDSTTVVNQAINQGAQGIFVVSHIDQVEKAIDVATVNQGRLALFSSPTLYNIKTLEQGQQAVKGLVITSPWHPQVNPIFAEQMKQQWHGTVSWRTATSYDATGVIIAGLQRSQTREGLQQVLRSSGFSFPGATGTVKFDSFTGDRLGEPVIIQVEFNGSKYEFALSKK